MLLPVLVLCAACSPGSGSPPDGALPTDQSAETEVPISLSDATSLNEAMISAGSTSIAIDVADALAMQTPTGSDAVEPSVTIERAPDEVTTVDPLTVAEVDEPQLGGAVPDENVAPVVVVPTPDPLETTAETPAPVVVPASVEVVDTGSAEPSTAPAVIDAPEPASEPAPALTPATDIDVESNGGPVETEEQAQPVQIVTAGTDEDTETPPVEGVAIGSDEDRELAPVAEVATPGSDEERVPEPELFAESDTDEQLVEQTDEPIELAPVDSDGDGVTDGGVQEQPVVEAEPVSEEPVIVAEPEPVAEEPVLVAEPEPVAEEPVLVVEAEPESEEPVVEAAPVAEEPVSEEPEIAAAVTDPAPVDADGDGVTDSDVEEQPVVVASPEPVVEEEEAPFEETVAMIDETEEEPVDLDEIFDAMNTEENVSMSFSDIAANGLDNACYLDTDHYIAEFLYQNPEVCFWEADERSQTVKALPTPVVPDDAVRLPPPSGGDDTSALERVINANRGGAVVGQGVYKVNRLDINVKVDIFDMPMKTTNGADEIVRVNASDVRIFNSPIDAEGSKTAHIGFHVDHGSDRFVLVNSGFSNIYHRQGNSASGVFLRGVDDFHVACNTFDNIVNNSPTKTKTARANAVWMNGAKSYSTSGGVIANNSSTELQSNGKLDDAEFFTMQSYKSTDKNRPVRIFANRSVNAGKRMTKHQADDAVVLSNNYYWRDKAGPLGDRKQFAMVNVQFSDNIIARNNRLKVAGDGRFDNIYHANGKWKGIILDNLHFDCNDIEVVDRISASSGTISQIIMARNDAESKSSTAFEATNSSANYNVIRGSGNVRFYYAFTEGYRYDGGRFETKGNQFLIPFVQAKYKGQ